MAGVRPPQRPTARLRSDGPVRRSSSGGTIVVRARATDRPKGPRELEGTPRKPPVGGSRSRPLTASRTCSWSRCRHRGHSLCAAGRHRRASIGGPRSCSCTPTCGLRPRPRPAPIRGPPLRERSEGTVRGSTCSSQPRVGTGSLAGSTRNDPVTAIDRSRPVESLATDVRRGDQCGGTPADGAVRR
jgi:hypothetical protein